MKSLRFSRSRAVSLWGCALAILLSASSAFAATTTTVKFCNDTSDGSNYTDNRAASGWSFTDIGADDTKNSGTYSHPVKFKGSTRAQSASTPSGSYLTQISLGVWIGNTARTVTVTPLLESGSAGTAQTATPSSTSGLIEMPFSFTLANCVTGVTVSIAASGNSTAYLYYATVTTETSGGGGVNTPPSPMQSSVDVNATVGEEATLDLENYFTDADGDSLTFALDSGDGDVMGSIWYFTPAMSGSFSAEVSATDPSGDSAAMTINVTVADTVLPPLSAPWIEAVYPEDVTTNGFVLRWMAVDNAVGYDLVVTNVVEQMEVGCQVSYSGPNYPDDRTVTATVTGLDPDTLYAVAVCALADPNPSPSSGYSDSDWSTPEEIATTIEGGLQRATLFDEGFSGAGNAWANTSAKPGDAETDCDSWSFPANVYNARSSIKIGGANAVGWALSPEITLSNEVAWADVVLSFSAAAYPGKSTKFSVSLVNSATGETNAIPSLTDLSPDKLVSTSVPEWSGGTDYSEEIVAPTRFKILFETISSASDKRLLLDSIKVTQVYDPSLVPLAAPVPTFNNATETTLQASWPSVAGATGYAVELRDSSGTRVAYDAAVSSSTLGYDFENLDWDSTYTLRLKAIGDGTETCNSPWSAAVTGQTLQNLLAPTFTASADAGAPVMAVISNKTFSVVAERDGDALKVTFSGLAPAPSGTTPTFANGTFSWTPEAGDEGKNFTATFTTDAGTYSTNIVFSVLARPELDEPTILAETIGVRTATVLWDPDGQIRASSYAYRLWHGSDTPTDTDVEREHFSDFVTPAGWSLSGTGWQTSASYTATPVKFDSEGDFAISKLYPATVTNLSFTIRKTSGSDSPIVKFHASTGSTNDIAWTEIEIALDATKATTNICLNFPPDAEYRRFKWVYEHRDSNVNLGSITAKYMNAGAKFKAGSVSEFVAAPDGNTIDLTGLRPETDYFIEVKVVGNDASEKTAKYRIGTLPAPVFTLMVLK